MASSVRWVLLGLLFCGHALAAAEWTTVGTTSIVSFLAIQQGSPFEGEFGSFTAEIDFERSDPASGSIVGVVEMGSVRTGDSRHRSQRTDQTGRSQAGTRNRLGGQDRRDGVVPVQGLEPRT